MKHNSTRDFAEPTVQQLLVALAHEVLAEIDAEVEPESGPRTSIQVVVGALSAALFRVFGRSAPEEQWETLIEVVAASMCRAHEAYLESVI